MTTILLYGMKAPSWNTLYAQGHWSKRKQLADDMHMLVRAALPPDIQPFDVPVDITITAYYKGALVDCDNICAKLLIDGLKTWVLRDDNPSWVHSVTTISLKGKRSHVIIELTPVTQR